MRDPDSTRTDSSRERINLTQAVWGLTEKVAMLGAEVRSQGAAIAELPTKSQVQQIVDDSWKDSINAHKTICDMQRKLDQADETRAIQLGLKPAKDNFLEKIDWNRTLKIAAVVGVFIGGILFGLATGKINLF